MTKPIPEGYTSVTPCLILSNCAQMIETYKQAFDAEEISRLNFPGTDRVMHAELRIGNARIMVQDEFPGCPSAAGTASSLYFYTSDCDAAIDQAKRAGFTETMAPQDMFWGDRMGALTDACGNQWTVATRVRDVSTEDIEKGAREMVEQMKSGQYAA